MNNTNFKKIKTLIGKKRNAVDNAQLNEMIENYKPLYKNIFPNIENEKRDLEIPQFEHTEAHCLSCAQVTHSIADCTKVFNLKCIEYPDCKRCKDFHDSPRDFECPLYELYNVDESPNN